MRTKTLLVAAALSAASLATTMAQVYSVNSVGYINLTMRPGNNAVANQLNTGNNGLNVVLPNAPLLAQVLTLVNNNYNIDVCDGAGAWFDNATGDPSTTLIPPGKGFFFGNPGGSDLVVTLVGEVPQGTSLTVPLNPGLNFVSGIVPQSLSLSAANGFPQVLLMQYQTYNRVTQSYDILVNGGPTDPNWYDNDTGDPADARAEVGLGFFVQNPGSLVSWTRCFNVNTPCP